MGTQLNLWRAALALGALALSGCGGEAVVRAGAEADATVAAPAAACSGTRLPVTGLCVAARASDFLRVNDHAPKLAARCEWTARELPFSEGTMLAFRAQDCSAEGFVPVVYDAVQSYVKFRMQGTPEDQAQFMLEIVPLSAGETAEQAAMRSLDKAPEGQRSRCAARALNGPILAGAAFELAPSRELASELDAAAAGEPWDACGPNGVTTTGMQIWEARNGYALFHMLGHDDPPWDPASFTFYRKGKDGKWNKAG